MVPWSLLYNLVLVQSYNINTEPSYTLKNKEENDSGLFGYSFASNKDFVLVGAPLKSNGTGDVFKCSLDSEECESIILNSIVQASRPGLSRFLGASVAKQDNSVSVCQPFYGKLTDSGTKINWLGRCFRKNTDLKDIGIWRVVEGVGKRSPMMGLGGITVNTEFTVFSELNSEFGQGGMQVSDASCEKRTRTGLDNEACFHHTTSMGDFSRDIFNKTAQYEWNKVVENYWNIDTTCKDKTKYCTPNDKKKKSEYESALASSYDSTLMGYSQAIFDLDGTGNYKGILLGAPSMLRSELNGRVVGYGLNMKTEASFFDSMDSSEIFVKSNMIKNSFSFDFFLDSSGFDDAAKKAQFGERFGSSVATCDFNGDGLQDIAVGAPTWFQKTDKQFAMDIGRVYVFLQKPGKLKKIDHTVADIFDPATVLYSPAGEGGHFGRAIACNGDLNDDGFDDLVVSAPFANGGSGEVYIFNGGPDCDDCFHSGFQQDTPSQTFEAPSLNEWFGFKLAFETDFDDNSYNDLVISSPKSENIYIYHTRPSIRTNIRISTPKKPLSIEIGKRQTSQVEICAKYSGKGLPTKMAGSINVELDIGTSNKRIYKTGNPGMYQFKMEWNTMRKDKEKCEVVNLDIHWTNGMDRIKPIDISASLTISIDENITLTPLVNIFSKSEATSSIELWKDCGSDNKCICTLDLNRLNVKIEDKEINYRKDGILAVDKTEKLLMNQILSIGPEKAYGVKIFAQTSEPIHNDQFTASINDEPIECTRLQDLFMCNPSHNPMENGQYNLTYTLQVRPNGEQDYFDVKIWVNDTNIESSQSEVVARVPVKIESQLITGIDTLSVITGDTKKQSQAWYYNETNEFDTESNQGRFVQTFFVKNGGPATIEESIVTVKVPVYAQNGEQMIRKENTKSSWRPTVLPENMKKVENNRRKECIFKNQKEVARLRQKNPQKKMEHNVFKCDDGSAICIVLECYIATFKGEEDTQILEIVMGEEDDQMMIDLDFVKSQSHNTKLTFEAIYEFSPKKFKYPIWDGKSGTHIRKNVATYTIDIVPFTENWPWWIILLAALGALLLLLLIAFICWKCGVFGNPGGSDDDGHIDQHKALIVKPEKPKAHQVRISDTENKY